MLIAPRNPHRPEPAAAAAGQATARRGHAPARRPDPRPADRGPPAQAAAARRRRPGAEWQHPASGPAWRLQAVPGGPGGPPSGAASRRAQPCPPGPAMCRPQRPPRAGGRLRAPSSSLASLAGSPRSSVMATRGSCFSGCSATRTSWTDKHFTREQRFALVRCGTLRWPSAHRAIGSCSPASPDGGVHDRRAAGRGRSG
jgi:hypothetical protein